jgi:hypothetical protein
MIMKSSTHHNRGKQGPESEAQQGAAENAHGFDQNVSETGNSRNISSAARQHSNDRQDDQSDSHRKGYRDSAQVHDTKGEAQNVNDDEGRPLNEEETEKARNKALEGKRQESRGI